MNEARNCDVLMRRLNALAEEMSGKKSDISAEAHKKAQAYNAAYWDVMRTGIPQDVLKEGGDGTGGFLVPDTFEQAIISTLTEKNLLRKLGTTLVTSRTMRIPISTRDAMATWIPEDLSVPVSDVTYGEIILDAHKLARLTLVSDEMLEDAQFDLERYIMEMSVQLMAQAEEEAFFRGDGKGKPLGLVHQVEVGAVTDRSGEICMDDMLNLLHSVRASYRENGIWLVSEDAYAKLRKLRNYEGQPLWRSSLVEGEPPKLLGHPILASCHLDEAAGGGKPVLFGNFKYFWIGDRGKRVVKRLSERYADQGQVAYITSERVDAKLVLPEAVKALEIKAE